MTLDSRLLLAQIRIILSYRLIGEHGEKFGTVTHWYKNGKMAGQGEFNFLSKGRAWKYWDEQGNEIKTQQPKVH